MESETLTGADLIWRLSAAAILSQIRSKAAPPVHEQSAKCGEINI